MAQHIMEKFLSAVKRAFNRGIYEFRFMGASVHIEKLDGVENVWVACTSCGSICSLHAEKDGLKLSVL